MRCELLNRLYLKHPCAGRITGDTYDTRGVSQVLWVIPHAAQIRAKITNHLNERPGADVADLYLVARKKQDVRPIEGNLVGRDLPIDTIQLPILGV